jgi:hypothetical protein
MHDEPGDDRFRFPGARAVVIGSSVFIGGFLAFAGGVGVVGTLFHVPVPSLFGTGGADRDARVPAALLKASPAPLPTSSEPPLPAASAVPVPAASAAASPTSTAEQRSTSPAWVPTASWPRPKAAIVAQPRAAAPSVPRPAAAGAARMPAGSPIARGAVRTEHRAPRPLVAGAASSALVVPARAGFPSGATLDPRGGASQSLLVDPGAVATPPPDAAPPRDP